MSLSAKQVEDVAKLARLQLTEEELATMTGQLSKILDYIDQLRAVATEDVPPLAHALPVQDVFRPDEPVPSLPIDEALANAPEVHHQLGTSRTAKPKEGAPEEQSFYGVPAVME